MIVGSSMPLIGVALSYVLGYLVTPMENLISDDGQLKGREYLK